MRSRVDAATWRYTVPFWFPDRWPRSPGPTGPSYSPGVSVEAHLDRIGPWGVVTCPALPGVALIEQAERGWIDPMGRPITYESLRGAVSDALLRLQPWQAIDGVDDVAILPLTSSRWSDIETVIVRRQSDGYTAIVRPGICPRDPRTVDDDAPPVGLVWNPDTDGCAYPCDMSEVGMWPGALRIAEGGG